MDELKDLDINALLDMRDIVQSILNDRRKQVKRQIQSINERLKPTPSPWRPR